MKRYVIVLLALAIMFAFVSCGKEASSETDLQEMTNEENETEASRELWSRRLSEVTDAQSTEETGDLTVESNDVSEEMVLTGYTHYNSNNTVMFHIECEYDEQGNLVQENWYHTVGGSNPYYWMEYEYDDLGNLVSSIDSDGASYEYDDLGNEVSCSGYFDEYGTEHVGYNYDYEYDDLGNVITRSMQYGDGRDGGWAEYEYDDLGNLICCNYHAGDFGEDHMEQYEYDAQGNIIRVTRDDDNSWVEYEYSYIN